MYVSETFFMYVHVVDVSISICVRVGPQDALLLRPKKNGVARRLSATMVIRGLQLEDGHLRSYDRRNPTGRD